MLHKAVANKVSYNEPLNKNYLGDNYTLVNAIRGSKNFHDGQWQAWLNTDMEVIIDLLEQQDVEQVIVGSMENQGSGIYFPTEVIVLVSTDGTSYKEVGSIKRPYTNNAISELKDFKINFKKQHVRYIKVVAKNVKDGVHNVWNSTFLFVDEILVK